MADLEKFIFFFGLIHHIMKLTATTEIKKKILLLTFTKQTSKQKNNTATKHSCFWMLRTHFHPLDLSCVRNRIHFSIFSRLPCQLFSQAHMLAWVHTPTFFPRPIFYANMVIMSKLRWRNGALTSLRFGGSPAKNRACLAGVVQLQTASVADAGKRKDLLFNTELFPV